MKFIKYLHCFLFRNGFTPLHHAVAVENVVAVEILLPFAYQYTNCQNQTPKDIAMEKKNSELIKMLEAANLKPPDSTAITVLQDIEWNVDHGDKKVVLENEVLDMTVDLDNGLHFSNYFFERSKKKKNLSYLF